ncbi:MAG: SBBP repeat-containing protein [Pyrinomonadaceae bacterium]
MSAAVLLATTLWSNRNAPAPPASQAPHERVREAYGRIPMSFEANRGQTDASVNFLARGAGYTFFLKPTEAVFVLPNADSGVEDEGAAERSLTTTSSPKTEAVRSKVVPRPKVLRMRLVGADASAPAKGLGELAGKMNYLVGDDSSQWRTGVPTFGRVRYAEVYPGVDVVYYGNQRQLEYDFYVAPGSDPRSVSLTFDGADRVEVDGRGDLLLTLGETVVRQLKPFIYQEVAGARREVEAGYEVGADGRVRFAVGEYDRGLPLVIDPVLVYSTRFGGSSASDIAIDSEGNAYVTGVAFSTDFPTVNPLQATIGGGSIDAFVAKINAAGSALVYSTYLGGGDNDAASDIAVDSAGNAYIAGGTTSTNFPTANAFQNAYAGGEGDAFVAKINAAGSALVYATYLGGSGSDFNLGIAVDLAGNAYVTGRTVSADFPTANALQHAPGGGDIQNAFLTKFNAAGSALVYSTYLGGNSDENGYGIAVDSAGNAYVTGSTYSTDFPTVNPIQAAKAGSGRDAFVTKMNAAGSALVYSTYLGGSDEDQAEDVAVDSAGNAYVTGYTASADFPTANPFQSGFDGGSTDVFLTKLNAAGSVLAYSTLLGGSEGEAGFGVAVDSAGNAYVAGFTYSANDFPTANALRCTDASAPDAFVAKFNAAGTGLVYSTYLGGDRANGLAVDSAGNAYVTLGGPPGFPTLVIGGAGSGPVVMKIGDASTAPVSLLQFTQTAPSVQEDVTSLTLTVQRTGDTSGAVTVDYATADVSARERSDYTTAAGTLRFAPGETAKTIDLLVNEDSFAFSFMERDETFTVSLSNATGGATLACLTATATVEIRNDGTEPTTNVIDDPATFVGTHYHDFLNRQADAPGLNFWTGQITPCGADAACIDRARTAVSTAFSLSIEFQQTGFYVFRFYKASFTDSAGRPRGMPRYREFLRDAKEVGRGVVVNEVGWEQLLEANKQEFAQHWVQRADFIAEFPLNMTADDYINQLFARSGVAPTPAEFNVAFEGYSNSVEGRANALRRVIESGSVYNGQFNAGFVLSQYVGYLRRNPNDVPDTDYTGFDFWLAKLDGFSQPGEDVRDEQTALARVNRAEMVRAFIRSLEYRGRFGQ